MQLASAVPLPSTKHTPCWPQCPMPQFCLFFCPFTMAGAKAITMKQALVIAAVCEFGGAVLLVSLTPESSPASPQARAHADSAWQQDAGF